MAACLINKNVYCIGGCDPEVSILDMDMSSDISTNFNSYLIKGSEKVALIEVCESCLFDQYVENIKDIADLSDVDYLIINDTEPDNCETVSKLIELLPNLTVLGSPSTLSFLRKITNKNFKSQEVINGDRLQLGNNTLRFINVSFLHWPDTIYIYLEEEKMLLWKAIS